MNDEPNREFSGNHRFLSNFYMVEVEYEGKVYPSAEHLYQALKAVDAEGMESVRKMKTAGQAARLGRRILCRADWEEVKEGLMLMVVRTKFEQNPLLSKWLKQTETRPLEEGNTWGDVYWGISLQTGEGENHLGKILEEVREGL